MKLIRILIFLLLSVPALSQVENRIPQYTFMGKLGVGRSGNNDTTAYLHIGTTQSTKGILFPRVVDTASVAGNKAHGLTIFSVQLDRPAFYDSVNAVWSAFGGGSDEETAVLSNVSTGYLALNFENEDTVFAKGHLAGLYMDLDSNGTHITHNFDTATFMPFLRSTFVSSAGDTANLVIINAGAGQQTWFDDNDTLNMKMLGNTYALTATTGTDSTLKYTIDTTLMATRAYAQSLGGGGGGCATCWTYNALNNPGADGLLGTADNNDLHFYTNNVKRGEIDNNGIFLWSGATPIGSRKAEFSDTSGMAYLRLGPQPTSIASSVALNSRLVITGSGTTSATGSIAIVNSAGTQHFTIRDDGSVTMPPIFGSITSTGLRMAGATVVYGVGNGAGTTGSMMSFTPLTTTTNIGSTTTNVVEINGNYQEISPWDDTGIFSSLSIKTTYNGTAGKGPGYVAGATFRTLRTDIPDYRAINIIDSGYIYANGALHMSNTKSVPSSGNYTVAKEDYFLYLNDVSGANRNVVLSDPLTNGRILVVFNTSADATFKWSFSGETVRDAAGTTYTTLTDGKCYTLIYNYGEWLITSITP